MVRTRRYGLLAGLCLLGLGALSCSLIIDAESTQCVRASDCSARGFRDHECVDSLCVYVPPKKDPRFACREQPWESPSEDEVKYPLSVQRLMGKQPYKGLTFYACPSFDTGCDEPVDKATSDAEGKFSLDLPVGFRGHLYAPAPRKDPDLIPLNAYVFPPPSNDPDVPLRSALVVSSFDVVGRLAKLDDVKLERGKGHVIFTAIDCESNPLEGVVVSTSVEGEDTWRVYVGAGGHPDPALEATGPSGQGAILNLPVGYLKVRGTHPEYGTIFEQSVVVSADKLVSVPVVPSPVLTSGP